MTDIKNRKAFEHAVEEYDWNGPLPFNYDPKVVAEYGGWQYIETDDDIAALWNGDDVMFFDQWGIREGLVLQEGLNFDEHVVIMPDDENYGEAVIKAFVEDREHLGEVELDEKLHLADVSWMRVWRVGDDIVVRYSKRTYGNPPSVEIAVMSPEEYQERDHDIFDGREPVDGKRLPAVGDTITWEVCKVEGRSIYIEYDGEHVKLGGEAIPADDYHSRWELTGEQQGNLGISDNKVSVVQSQLPLLQTLENKLERNRL